MVKPIRRSLLTHTIEYSEYSNDDVWGVTYKKPVTIERVRLEPKETVVFGMNNRQIIGNTLLFHDSVHSTPCKFVPESKVIFNGRELVVQTVNEYYDKERLHHVEVVLI